MTRTSARTFLLSILLLALPAGAAEPPAAAPVANGHGFAEYLPADVSGFFSCRGLADVWASIKDSNFGKEFWENPATVAARFGVQMSPQGQEALENLQKPEVARMIRCIEEILGDEMVIAADGTASEDFYRLMSVLAHGFLALEDRIPAPREILEDGTPAPLGPKAKAHATTVLAELGRVRVPSIVMAAKIRSPDVFKVLLELLAAGVREQPAGKFLKAPAAGEPPVYKIVLSIGDFVPKEALAAKIQEASLGLDTDAVANALRNLKVEIQIGILKDYLCVFVGSDGSFADAIRARMEGGTGLKRFSEAAPFQSLLADAKGAILGMVWADSSKNPELFKKYLKDVLDEVMKSRVLSSLDDQVGEQIGARLRSRMARVHKQVSDALQEAVILRRVSWRDAEGIAVRGTLRRLDGSHAVSTPLRLMDAIPRETLGVWAARGPEPKAAWEKAQLGLQNFYDNMSGHGMNTDMEELEETIKPLAETARKVFEKDILPHLGREVAVLADARLGEIESFEGAPAWIKGIPLPRLAVLFEVRDDAAFRKGVSTLFAELREQMKANPKLETALPMDPTLLDVRGVNASAYPIPGFKGDFVPHALVKGNICVVSTSLALSASILDRMAGKEPAFVDDPAFKALFPNGTVANQISHIDTLRLWKMGETMTLAGDRIAREVVKEQAKLGGGGEGDGEDAPAPQLQGIVMVRESILGYLRALRAVRSISSSVRDTGVEEVFEGRILVKDLPKKPP
ncbi:MAG: hypothetical protein AAB215_08515 [Planctomycetota bacterium]